MDRAEVTRPRSYRLPLPPHKIASRQAHRVLEWALRDWRVEGEPADNTRVVLSEMVTNALSHSLNVFRLALHLQPDQIVVEVWDGADGMPYVGLPDGLSVNGRGMFLVDALSKEWGVRPEAEGGKTVWAKVPR
jgi:anti-sigma regulatory factor (Ser/Thr protein kinase)